MEYKPPINPPIHCAGNIVHRHVVFFRPLNDADVRKAPGAAADETSPSSTRQSRAVQRLEPRECCIAGDRAKGARQNFPNKTVRQCIFLFESLSYIPVIPAKHEFQEMNPPCCPRRQKELVRVLCGLKILLLLSCLLREGLMPVVCP